MAGTKSIDEEAKENSIEKEPNPISEKLIDESPAPSFGTEKKQVPALNLNFDMKVFTKHKSPIPTTEKKNELI